MNELFYNSSEVDRENGFVKNDTHYICLICGYKTEKGIIYPSGDLYFDSKRKMENHISEEHGTIFDYLIQQEKKINGFSEHQSKIMSLLHQGKTDYEIQEALNVGSISTIRNHRHILKEKERQAKVMTTLMSLLNKNMNKKNILDPHTTATMVDKRYDATIEEAVSTIKKYFVDGKLKTFSMKEKYKIIILREIMKSFEQSVQYSEKEVDKILKEIYLEDYVLIRRYLIEYGFMDRTKDCKYYWVKEKHNPMKKMNGKKREAERRKELMNSRYFSEKTEIESGVYQIKNIKNNKIYIGSARNIKKLEGLKFQLNMGSFMNKSLQEEWKAFGEENFEIAILESFEEEEITNVRVVNKKLKELERKWKEKLQPYAEQGYHNRR